MENKKLSMIVPCYNEEKVLPLFFDEAMPIFSALSCPWELIFVNDGSRDSTLSLLKEFAKKDNRIKYISLSRNFGKEAAMLAGLDAACGDLVGFMDADLQHPPRLLPAMLNKLEESGAACVACRRNRRGDAKIRTFFARAFYRLSSCFSKVKMADGAGDFRIMTRKMADAVASFTEHNRFSKGIFSWVGFETVWIDYENVDRAAGKSSWSFGGLFRYAMSGLYDFSDAPLRFPAFFGGLALLCFIAYLCFLLYKWSLGKVAFTVSAVTLLAVLSLGSVILFSIAILGRYIASINAEAKNRPLYLVAEDNLQSGEDAQ